MSAAKNTHNNKEAARILIELQSKTEDETLMDYRRQLLQNGSSESDKAQYKFPDQVEPSMWPWAYPNPPLAPFNPGAMPFYPACLPNSTPVWFPPCLEPGKYSMPPFHGMDFQHALAWPAPMHHGLFDPSHPSRRRRTKFTEEQLAVLEKTFTKGSKFPSPGERMRLEARTGLSKEKISVWFQNRRAKEKREKSQEGTIKEAAEPILTGSDDNEIHPNDVHLRISEAKQQEECETEYVVAETSNVELDDEQESKQEVGQKRLHEHEDSPFENTTSKSKVIYLEQLEPEQYKFSELVNEDDAIHDVDTRDVGTSIEAGDVADDGRAYPYRPQVLKGILSKRRKLFTSEAEKTDSTNNNKQHFSGLEYRIFGET